MKIYNGWVLKIDDKEFVVAGSINNRGKISYLLRSRKNGEISSITRPDLLSAMNSGEISYVRSVAAK